MLATVAPNDLRQDRERSVWDSLEVMSVSDRLAPFGVTIFSEMTALAQEYDAINLGQGFPNWDGADFVKRAQFISIRFDRFQGKNSTFGNPIHSLSSSSSFLGCLSHF